MSTDASSTPCQPEESHTVESFEGVSKKPRPQSGRGRRVVAILLLVLTPFLWFFELVMWGFGRLDNSYGYTTGETLAFALVAVSVPGAAVVLRVSRDGAQAVMLAILILLVALLAVLVAVKADPMARTPFGRAFVTSHIDDGDTVPGPTSPGRLSHPPIP